MLSISSVVGLLLVVYFVWRYLIYPAFFSPLAKIPNAHFSVPWSALWILWHRYRVEENQTIHAAHLRHGKIVRLGPNEVSVASVDDGIRIIYGGGFDKHAYYSNQFDNYGTPCMFSTTDSRPHSARKRMISHVYSKSTIQSSSVFHQASHILINEKLLPLLRSNAAKGEIVDVWDLNSFIAMDFVTAYLFGLGNGTDFLVDREAASEWLKVYRSRRLHFFWDAEFPLLAAWSRKLGLSLIPKEVNEATDVIGQITLEKMQLANSKLNELEKGADTELTFVSVYNVLRKGLGGSSSSSSKDTMVPDLRIASELHDSAIAGHDTTGIALVYLFWELSRQPALQHALRKEFTEYSASISLPAPQGPTKTLPTPRLLDSLPLLHAVLMETLRLHAPIPGPQPRRTPVTPTSVSGSPPLPPGVRISSQSWTLHRNAEVFEDSEEWRPRRWLDASEDKKAEMHKWWWPFGSGSRMCIGKNLAMQEMKLVTTAIYSNFTTHVIDDAGIEQMDLYTAPPKGSVFLRFDLAE